MCLVLKSLTVNMVFKLFDFVILKIQSYCFFFIVAIVFVYDYYPSLDTLQQRLYNNQNFNLKGWANPYNLDGSARPYSAGKGKIGNNNNNNTK
jgi:hypothetical protein